MKTFFLSLLLTSSLFAQDYCEMSNQELISIMGYVSKQNISKFDKELKKRISTMNKREKRAYKHNKKKEKK